jgi:ComF family protein
MINLLTKLSTSITHQVNNSLSRLNALCPRQCQLCNTKSFGTNICYYCDKSLPRLHNICQLCSWPIMSDKETCELCINFEHSAGAGAGVGDGLQGLAGIDKKSKIKIAMPYIYPIDKLISKFKYHGDLAKGRLLADILLQYILADQTYILPEVIIPVPIHNNKLKQRGFNQSIEIGRYLAKNLGIKLDCNLIAKYKQTDAQMGQNKSGRIGNIHGSFCFNKRPQYKSVAIIDDVVTTGSTAFAVANLLYTANISNISLWAIARRC